MLARKMSRNIRTPPLPLDAEDLEQEAICELLRVMPWNGSYLDSFERFAWYAFRSGISDAIKRANWRGWAYEIPGRTQSPLGEEDFEAPEDTPDEVDGCVICGGSMVHKRSHAIHCSRKCQWRLEKMRAEVMAGESVDSVIAKMRGTT